MGFPENGVMGSVEFTENCTFDKAVAITGNLTVSGSFAASSVASLGTLASVTGLTVSHTTDGLINKSVFTLANVPQTVVNGTEYQGTKLFDFPEGWVKVEGVIATLAQKTTSALASTLNASSTGAVALGTATASNTTLASTMVDLLPSTAFTSSATVNVAGTAVSAGLAAGALFNGTATAKSIYLNSAYATTADVDGDATQTFTGTITVVWMLIGDY